MSPAPAAARLPDVDERAFLTEWVNVPGPIAD
jgi:hypothetical protein